MHFLIQCGFKEGLSKFSIFNQISGFQTAYWALNRLEKNKNKPPKNSCKDYSKTSYVT